MHTWPGYLSHGSTTSFYNRPGVRNLFTITGRINCGWLLAGRKNN